MFIMYGLMSLEYLYAREKLHWSIENYTIFSAVSTIISFFGGFFGIMVVQRFLHVSDLAFVNIAFFTSIVENVIKALAVDSWHMYLGEIVFVLFPFLKRATVADFFDAFYKAQLSQVTHKVSFKKYLNLRKG